MTTNATPDSGTPLLGSFPKEVRLTAAQWVVDLHAAADPERLREPFERWLAESPGHFGLYYAMRVARAFREYLKSPQTRADLLELDAVISRNRPILSIY